MSADQQTNWETAAKCHITWFSVSQPSSHPTGTTRAAGGKRFDSSGINTQLYLYYIYIYTRIYLYLYVDVYVYICMYICIYIYVVIVLYCYSMAYIYIYMMREARSSTLAWTAASPSRPRSALARRARGEHR